MTATSDRFRIGGVAHLEVTFRNDANAPTDPSTATLKLRFPDGTTQTKATVDLVHSVETPGVYSFDLPLTMSRRHYWEWIGDGDVTGDDAGSFYVFRSPVREAAA